MAHVGGRRFEEGEEELPGQQVSQNAGVLHAEGLDHRKLADLDRRQDAFTQLLAGGQDGHQSSRRRAEQKQTKINVRVCESRLKLYLEHVCHFDCLTVRKRTAFTG